MIGSLGNVGKLYNPPEWILDHGIRENPWEFLKNTEDNLATHMGVSKNNGTPKSSILIGFSIINHPFWGFSPYFWKYPYVLLKMVQTKGPNLMYPLLKPSGPWPTRCSLTSLQPPELEIPRLAKLEGSAYLVNFRGVGRELHWWCWVVRWHIYII